MGCILRKWYTVFWRPWAKCPLVTPMVLRQFYSTVLVLGNCWKYRNRKLLLFLARGARMLFTLLWIDTKTSTTATVFFKAQYTFFQYQGLDIGSIIGYCCSAYLWSFNVKICLSNFWWSSSGHVADFYSFLLLESFSHEASIIVNAFKSRFNTSRKRSFGHLLGRW